MQIFILFLAALAVVLAGAALILVVQERRHNRGFVAAVDQRFKGMAKVNEKSKTALLQYVDEGDKKANGRIDRAFVALKAVNDKTKKHDNRITDLEHGVVPDYESARKAADEFNKFNEGIAGILGYDPLEAMKKSRQEDN